MYNELEELGGMVMKQDRSSEGRVNIAGTTGITNSSNVTRAISSPSSTIKCNSYDDFASELLTLSGKNQKGKPVEV